MPWGVVSLFVITLIKGTGNLISTYRFCFAVLGIPALITIALVVISRIKFPNPEIYEISRGDSEEKFVFKPSFIFYMTAICLFAFGFADFTMITLHAAESQLFPDSVLSLLYAAAMAVDAFAALFFGWLFDKIGLKALILSTLCSMLFAPFVFLGSTAVQIGIGIVLWGIGMGAQESIMKAAVSKIMPKSMRSTGFGIFETGFGIAWFLGSWTLGALYDVNVLLLVIVSVAAQLLSVVFYAICISKENSSYT